MAGKADLVNSIADSASYVQDVPGYDWQASDDAAKGPAYPAPGGSLELEPFG